MGQNHTTEIQNEQLELEIEDIIPDITLMAFYLTVGIVGNAAVIFIYRDSGQHKPKSYKQFIFILAVVDLISCILNCILNIMLVIGTSFLENMVVCKTMRFLCHVIAVTSAFILFVIAFQRYLFVCKPFKSQMTPCIRKFSIIMCGMLSTALSSPVLVFYGTSETKYTKISSCEVMDSYVRSKELLAYNIIFILVTIIVITGISLMYFAILRTIKVKQVPGNGVKFSRSNTSTDNITMTVDINHSMLSLNNRLYMYASTSFLSTRKTHLSFRQHMLTLMFITVTIFCIVSSAPRRIIEFEEVFDKSAAKERLGGHDFLYRFLYTLYILNNVVNPYIYGLFDRDLRNKLKRICKRQ
ncbi:unnamed protein product [Mytilus coruscus]|uniref:G-protein coupled receptors family 1 profile domain-containing protein n=1 Tax=Mytilus coruscus TaxID=42192 RepID=A0A6J8EG26_MYTCO|nr:unnamed protein product [Mytilus coruscus]